VNSSVAVAKGLVAIANAKVCVPHPAKYCLAVAKLAEVVVQLVPS
jgi:hypothetical protein